MKTKKTERLKGYRRKNKKKVQKKPEVLVYHVKVSEKSRVYSFSPSQERKKYKKLQIFPDQSVYAQGFGPQSKLEKFFLTPIPSLPPMPPKANGLVSLFAALCLVAFFGTFIFTPPQTNQAAVIATVQTVKNVSVVAGGNSIKWTAIVKRSDISPGKYLLALPKSARNIKIQTVNAKQVEDILQSKPKEQLSLKQRVKVAVANEPKSFFAASLLDSLSKFFLSSLDNGVQTIIDSTNSNIQITRDATVVDLSNKASAETPTPGVSGSNDQITPPTETPTKTTTDYVKVDYETLAPVITEQNTETGKLVTVSAPTETQNQPPLTDVLASSKIPEIYKVGQESKIKIKWTNENNQEVSFHAYDTNNNGKLDYVEWTVPHLSTQIFEIIFISKAFQLDQGQNMIADIYDTLKAKDGNYTTISNGQYVRATFYEILDKTKDITLYAKSANAGQSGSVEVYPVYTDSNGNQTEGPQLATVSDKQNPDFSVINNDGKYRILLSNLQTPTDVFDLKITKADIAIDYVVDPTPFSSGLIAYYPLNGDANDYSGNGNNGTWTGSNAPGSYTTGQVGNAAVFNGSDDYIVASDTNFPSGSSARTVSAWMKSSSGNGSIVSYGTSNVGERFAIWNGWSSSNLYFAGYADDFNGSSDINDGNWHYVAVTYDGSDVRLYVDGKFETNSTEIGSALNTVLGGYLFIGNDIQQAGQYFNGLIDEVAIWNKALSDSDITTLWNNGSGIAMLYGNGSSCANNSDCASNVCSSSVCTACTSNTDCSGSANGSYCDTRSGDGACTTGDPGVFCGANSDCASPCTCDTSSTYKCTAPITYGLVAYYPLDGNANDYSVNEDTGTWSKNENYTAGKIGKTGIFTGVPTYMGGANNLGISGSQPWSASAWFNPTLGYSWDGGNMGLYGIYSIGPNTWSNNQIVSIDMSNDGIYINLWGGNNVDVPVDLIGWHLITTTYDGTNLRLYSNSTLIYTLQVSLSLNNEPLKIGDIVEWGDNGTVNYIDEVAVWNRTLSIDDITTLYNGGSGMAIVPRLIAEYQFNGDATDSSGNGNNGTWSGTPAYDTGVSGQAALFDGSDDYIVANDANLPSGNSPRTVSAWIKTTAPSNVDDTIFASGTPGDSNTYTLRAIGNSGTLMFNGYGGGYDINTDDYINNGSWHFIVATYNGSDVIVYLDGSPVGSNSMALNTILNGNFYIGTYLDQTLNFTGLIDDVKIYNYARSAEDIAAEFATFTSHPNLYVYGAGTNAVNGTYHWVGHPFDAYESGYLNGDYAIGLINGRWYMDLLDTTGYYLSDAVNPLEGWFLRDGVYPVPTVSETPAPYIYANGAGNSNVQGRLVWDANWTQGGRRPGGYVGDNDMVMYWAPESSQWYVANKAWNFNYYRSSTASLWGAWETFEGGSTGPTPTFSTYEAWPTTIRVLGSGSAVNALYTWDSGQSAYLAGAENSLRVWWDSATGSWTISQSGTSMYDSAESPDLFGTYQLLQGSSPAPQVIAGVPDNITVSGAGTTDLNGDYNFIGLSTVINGNPLPVYDKDDSSAKIWFQNRVVDGGIASAWVMTETSNIGSVNEYLLRRDSPLGQWFIQDPAGNASGSANAPVVTAHTLIAEYNFDGNALDSSGNGNNGIWNKISITSFATDTSAVGDYIYTNDCTNYNGHSNECFYYNDGNEYWTLIWTNFNYGQGWYFDKGLDTAVYGDFSRDFSSYNDYTSSGTPAISYGSFASGVSGQAVSFDGASGIITSLTDITGGGDGSALTIGYWIKETSNGMAVAQQPDGPNYILMDYSGIDALSFNQDSGLTYGGGIYGQPIDSSSGSTYNDGNWHYAVMTWQRNTTNGFKTYLDGQLVAEATSFDNPIPNLNSPVTIGFRYPGSFPPDGFVTGLIDDVKIYNYARSVEDISAEYNSLAPRLIAEYNFDNPANDGSVTDNSGNGNTGTWSGTEAYTSGISGNAASFDNGSNQGGSGSGYITTPILATSGDSFTYTFWVNRGTQDYQGFPVSRQSGTGGNIQTEFSAVDDSLTLVIRDSNGNYAVSYLSDPKNNGFRNEWSFVAQTVDSLGNSNFYINGQSVDSKSSDVRMNGLGVIQIGANENSAWFTGAVDDVKIYNYVLSPEEIDAEYDALAPSFDCASENNCNGNGTCVSQDTCSCNSGWLGSSCSIQDGSGTWTGAASDGDVTNPNNWSSGYPCGSSSYTATIDSDALSSYPTTGTCDAGTVNVSAGHIDGGSWTGTVNFTAAGYVTGGTFTTPPDVTMHTSSASWSTATWYLDSSFTYTSPIVPNSYYKVDVNANLDIDTSVNVVLIAGYPTTIVAGGNVTVQIGSSYLTLDGGTISGGDFTGTNVPALISGTIAGGTWDITTIPSDIIWTGGATGATNITENNGTIQGGTFDNFGTNNGQIDGGTFTNTGSDLSIAGTINGGTFNGALGYLIYISGLVNAGTFTTSGASTYIYAGSATINGGTFDGDLMAMGGIIHGGVFNGSVNSAGVTWDIDTGHSLSGTATFGSDIAVNGGHLEGGTYTGSITWYTSDTPDNIDVSGTTVYAVSPAVVTNGTGNTYSGTTFSPNDPNVFVGFGIPFIWTGAKDGNLEDADNWVGGVPTSSDPAIIAVVESGKNWPTSGACLASTLDIQSGTTIYGGDYSGVGTLTDNGADWGYIYGSLNLGSYSLPADVVVQTGGHLAGGTYTGSITWNTSDTPDNIDVSGITLTANGSGTVVTKGTGITSTGASFTETDGGTFNGWGSNVTWLGWDRDLGQSYNWDSSVPPINVDTAIFSPFSYPASGYNEVLYGTCYAGYITVSGDVIWGGTFNGITTVTTGGVIRGGTWGKSVEVQSGGELAIQQYPPYGVGTYNGTVIVDASGTISAGTFNDAVTSSGGIISGGVFTNTLTLNTSDTTISGATLDGATVTADGVVVTEGTSDSYSSTTFNTANGGSFIGFGLCSNHGIWDGTSCSCNLGYYGPDCEYDCIAESDCNSGNSQSICIAQDTCSCSGGWLGSSCSLQAGDGTWTGAASDGDVANPDNWSSGYPCGGTHHAIIDSDSLSSYPSSGTCEGVVDLSAGHIDGGNYTYDGSGYGYTVNVTGSGYVTGGTFTIPPDVTMYYVGDGNSANWSTATWYLDALGTIVSPVAPNNYYKVNIETISLSIDTNVNIVDISSSGGYGFATINSGASLNLSGVNGMGLRLTLDGGTISGGDFTGSYAPTLTSGTIAGGTWDITTIPADIIWTGGATGATNITTNNGTIQGGTFDNFATNNGTITAGTFSNFYPMSLGGTISDSSFATTNGNGNIDIYGELTNATVTSAANLDIRSGSIINSGSFTSDYLYIHFGATIHGGTFNDIYSEDTGATWDITSTLAGLATFSGAITIDGGHLEGGTYIGSITWYTSDSPNNIDISGITVYADGAVVTEGTSDSYSGTSFGAANGGSFIGFGLCNNYGSWDGSSCLCDSGYYGSDCGYTCSAVSDCNSHGTCVSQDTCSCNTGYYGTSCEYNCITESDCNSHGTCVSQDTCSCDSGWQGDSACSTYSCEGVSYCSGSNGSCMGANNCSCNTGWAGSDCSSYDNSYWCSGNGSYNGSTCSCNSGWLETDNLPGDCSGYDNSFWCYGNGTYNGSSCTCNTGWTGTFCGDFDNSYYCNSHGTYNGNSCNCDSGWQGDSVCSTYSCEGVNYCSGYGSCSGANTCYCNTGYHGSDCSYDCGMENDCNGNGTCVSQDTCSCSTGWAGNTCSSYDNSYWCSGNGTYNGSTCSCNAGWLETDNLPGDCSGYDNSYWCNSRGTYDGNSCSCDSGYAGSSCQYSDATTCNSHGTAQSDGSCSCYQDGTHGYWSGSSCSTCSSGWTGSSCAEENISPVASDIHIDSDASTVTLFEGTTRDVVCVATISDSNGYSDMTTVSAKFYRSGVGAGASDDNSNHYTLSDVKSTYCSGSGTSGTCSFTFHVQYYADPTDTGSTFAAQNWVCKVTPSDNDGAGTADTDTIEMSTLKAFSVTPTIDYGSLNPGQHTSSPATATITNTGNTEVSFEVSGENLSCTGIGSIPVSNQQYGLSSFDYGDGLALSDTPAETGANLSKPTQSTPEVTKDSYWQIFVPAGTKGTCSGATSFIVY